MKKYGLVLVVAAVIIAIVLFPSEKKRIKKVIRTCEQAVINENSEALMSLISFNYLDDYGGSYLTLKKDLKDSIKPMMISSSSWR